MKKALFTFLLSASLNAFSLPSEHLDLLPYLQPAPDQGETNTCLFVSSTGAVELLLNQKYNVRYPKKGDLFDISERFAITYPSVRAPSWYEVPVHKFNVGWAIHENTLPFNAFMPDGKVNWAMWYYPKDFYTLPRLELNDKFDTKRLFIKGGRYATHVLKDEDVETVKKALVEYNAPILVNYNDEGWWHMILIVGYSDNVVGECYYTPEEECRGQGAFIVRDSNGHDYEYRDYDWFRVNGNAAFVVTIKKD